MLDTRIDIEVIKKEFENEMEFIKKLRYEALNDSKRENYNNPYFEGKYVAYDYMIDELNSLYSHIMSSISIIQNIKIKS